MASLTIYRQHGTAPNQWFAKETRVGAPDFADKAIERYAEGLEPGEHTLLATFGEAAGDSVLWLYRVTVEPKPAVTVERI